MDPIAHTLVGASLAETGLRRSTRLALAGGIFLNCVLNGRLLRDNTYGTLEEAVVRRDFTVNSLYFDAMTEEVLDFVSGVRDLNDRCLRLIGEAEVRFEEHRPLVMIGKPLTRESRADGIAGAHTAGHS